MSRGTLFSDATAGGDRVWLDGIARVSGLAHETTYPGGDSQAHWQMTLDTTAQHRAWAYGRRIGISIGGDELWHGNLDTPVRDTIWSMTAIGRAAQAKQYVALAATSGNALNLNEVVDAAITRGLPFTRAVSLPALASTASTAPSGSLMIDQALDQVAAGQTAETYWSIDTFGTMSMGAAPTTPTYTLFATTAGGGRSLAGFITDAFVIYQSASGVLSVNQRSAPSRPYGRFEAAVDQTSLGLIPSSQANTLGDGYIARNGARAKFTNTFAVRRGQLVNQGGQAVDLATVRAGFLANVIFTDPDSAGEVVLGVIPQVLIGGTSYDWDTDVLTLTPVTSAQDNLTALLGAGSGLQ